MKTQTEVYWKVEYETRPNGLWMQRRHFSELEHRIAVMIDWLRITGREFEIVRARGNARGPAFAACCQAITMLEHVLYKNGLVMSVEDFSCGPNWNIRAHVEPETGA